MSIVMEKKSRRVWVGVILIVLGLSLMVTSYFNVYSEQMQKVAQRVLLMEGNSSADLDTRTFIPVHSTLALVWVVGSPELQSVLNSSLNYSSSVGNPITITLSDGTRNVSASVYAVAVFGDYWLPQPVYASWFTIPSDWGSVIRVTISNSESHPVCWVATCILYERVTHYYWLAVMLLGTVCLLTGAIISVTAIPRKKSEISARHSEVTAVVLI